MWRCRFLADRPIHRLSVLVLHAIDSTPLLSTRIAHLLLGGGLGGLSLFLGRSFRGGLFLSLGGGFRGGRLVGLGLRRFAS